MNQCRVIQYISLYLALGSPTSIDFIHNEQIVVGYSTAKVVVYDVETGSSVVTMDSALTYSKSVSLYYLSLVCVCCIIDGTTGTQINKVMSHPTLPVIVTAHEDKYICFFDSKSGMFTINYRPTFLTL